MFFDLTGFSETIDWTQQTSDLKGVKSKIVPSDTLVTRQ